MRFVKKIDIYLLRNFLGLFLATFFIAIFILLMQFMWMHVNDLVGKGISLGVLAEFFLYACASVVPLALPLAILLSSLIAFGNLAEKFELTAMKAAGISLFRIMRPLTIAIAMLSVGAFFFSNNVLPRSQMKLWALIFSLRQKSPELQIPIGEFYDEISGYHIYVREKTRKGELLNMMIYDYSSGFHSAKVMVADTGRLASSADKRYLILELINGESFENLDKNQQRATGKTQNIPYRRETFSRKQIVIDFSTDFNRYDESMLEDQHVSKNVAQLIESIDSVKVVSKQTSREQSNYMIKERYFSRDDRHETVELPVLDKQELETCDIDSLWNRLSVKRQQMAYNTAEEKARNYRDQVEYHALLLDDAQRYIRKHQMELYRKFTLAFACLVFFFIGAPLGAIIRKGGLGAPVVISVIMFIVYYIIDNTGYKMAREALWPCWAGMWLSSFVLLPIGIFLTYKAATDSPLFNPEAWEKEYVRLKNKTKRLLKKIYKKLSESTLYKKLCESTLYKKLWKTSVSANS
ncbi:MAG: LptF/LptG family permease [Paludibacteraceae bacterium]|nr:LptF/LptG family permease [Paludibacteraceae bacterium]